MRVPWGYCDGILCGDFNALACQKKHKTQNQYKEKETKGSRTMNTQYGQQIITRWSIIDGIFVHTAASIQQFQYRIYSTSVTIDFLKLLHSSTLSYKSF